MLNKSGAGTALIAVYGFMVLAMVAPGGLSHAQETPVDAASVSEIIANPKKFDGQELLIAGVASGEFEDVALYANTDVFNHVWFPGSIEVVLSDKQLQKFRELHGKFVVVRGVYGFQELRRGVIAPRGTIQNVSFMRPLEARGPLSDLGQPIRKN